MLIKLAWRNVWRNKLRTSIILGAMVFGLAGVTAMMGFMTGLVDSMLSNAIRWQTSHIQLHNHLYITNPDISEQIDRGEQLADKLRQLPGVDAVSARFVVAGMVASARSNRGVHINGVNVNDEIKVTPLDTRISSGEWLDGEGRNPVVVSKKLAERLTLKVGSKVVLTFTEADGQVVGAAYRVKGIFSTPSTQFDEGNVFVRKADLQKTAAMTGVHEIALLLNNADTAPAAKQAITDLLKSVKLGDTVTVRDWQQIQPMLASMMSTMDVSNQIILVIFVVAMMFGIINVMLMSVFERTQELGVLMAVGMQKHKVFGLIMLETILLGMSGALIGLAVSAALIALLHHYGIPLDSMSDGLGAYGVDTILYPRVSFREYQLTLVTIFVASVLAAIYPARQIIKKRPVDAMAEKN